MEELQALFILQKQKLHKSLMHLDYSFKKVLQLPDEMHKLDEEQLETWESFAARFSRTADLFLTKVLRTFVYLGDPGFEGSLRDFLNKGEKLGIIKDVNQWFAIRQLRNLTVHEYTDQKMDVFFQQLKTMCPILLNLKRWLAKI